VQLPITDAVVLPTTSWPPEAFVVQEACGIRWDWADIRRFLSFTRYEHGCRVWNGAKSRGSGNQQWYGSFYTQGKTVRAHKFAAVTIYGLRPKPGVHVDHGCDRTLCTSHLRLLLKRDNEARIRRPRKDDLDLARFCNMTAAGIMLLPEERRAVYVRMMRVTEEINAGRTPKGVIVCRRRGR